MYLRLVVRVGRRILRIFSVADIWNVGEIDLAHSLPKNSKSALIFCCAMFLQHVMRNIFVVVFVLSMVIGEKTLSVPPGRLNWVCVCSCERVLEIFGIVYFHVGIALQVKRVIRFPEIWKQSRNSQQTVWELKVLSVLGGYLCCGAYRPRKRKQRISTTGWCTHTHAVHTQPTWDNRRSGLNPLLDHSQQCLPIPPFYRHKTDCARFPFDSSEYPLSFNMEATIVLTFSKLGFIDLDRLTGSPDRRHIMHCPLLHDLSHELHPCSHRIPSKRELVGDVLMVLPGPHSHGLIMSPIGIFVLSNHVWWRMVTLVLHFLPTLFFALPLYSIAIKTA